MLNCQVAFQSANYYETIYEPMIDTTAQEIATWKEKITKARVPQTLADKLIAHIERIAPSGQIAQWDQFVRCIEWVTALPWERETADILNIDHVREILNNNHHGLEAIKKRILEYISVLILEKARGVGVFHAPILLFVGLAGTGKTSIAQSIAQAVGRTFVRIPFGGLSSALDLRGLSKIQPEAEPGAIIKSLREAQSRNPVILLDEIDRVSEDSRGAIMGVLLELLDPEQNRHFTDHYIDYPFDLSHVLFIATANTTHNISTAVMDRLETIAMPSYTDEEKIIIAKKYILPRLLTKSGLASDSLSIYDAAFKKMARQTGFDPGIRSIERSLEAIVRKAAFQLVNKAATSFTINEQNLNEYLE